VNVIYSGATSGVGNVYPSGALEFTHGFQWGSRCSIFNFPCCVVLCPSFFLIFVWPLY